MRSYRPSAPVSARAIASVCTPHLEISETGLGPTKKNKDGRTITIGLRNRRGLSGGGAKRGKSVLETCWSPPVDCRGSRSRFKGLPSRHSGRQEHLTAVPWLSRAPLRAGSSPPAAPEVAPSRDTRGALAGAATTIDGRVITAPPNSTTSRSADRAGDHLSCLCERISPRRGAMENERPT